MGAYRWAKRGADLDDARCMRRAAFLLRRERSDGPPNHPLALVYLSRAAEQGEHTACGELGLCFHKGHCGLSVDLAEARRWYTKAVGHGAPDDVVRRARNF